MLVNKKSFFLVSDAIFEVNSKRDSFTIELLRLVAMGVDNTSEDPDVKNIHFKYILLKARVPLICGSKPCFIEVQFKTLIVLIN